MDTTYCCKHASVTPVFKSGDNRILGNYRPISILSFYSKIIEKLIYSRINNFITKYDIISPSQFGFRKGKSTEHALIEVLEFLYAAIDDRQYSIGIFIDYRKAFDTVPHSILLRKLERYGIRGVALDLFHSYLCNRKQVVRINNTYSNEVTINVGVPQGSILGPILFILYINDLCNLSTDSKFVLFADDTTILFRNNSLESLYEVCNREMLKFMTWTIANQLTLNVDKTFYMLFSNKPIANNLPCIYYGNSPLVREHECKFLGIRLDDKLRFDKHIKQVSSKASKLIGIIYRIRDFVPSSVLKTLYYSLFYPYVCYGSMVWGFTYECHLNSLFIIQKRIIRLINRQPPYSHTNELFIRNKILKLKEILEYRLLNYMFDGSLNFELVGSHGYNTRSSMNLRTSLNRTVKTQRSLKYIGPSLWNKLPTVLRTSENCNLFKRNLRNLLFARYA